MDILQEEHHEGEGAEKGWDGGIRDAGQEGWGCGSLVDQGCGIRQGRSIDAEGLRRAGPVVGSPGLDSSVVGENCRDHQGSAGNWVGSSGLLPIAWYQGLKDLKSVPSHKTVHLGVPPI